MRLKSIILGIATTAVLISVLVATRMMLLTTSGPELEVREVETVALAEPPPPAPEELSEDDPPPPPPPSLVDLTPTMEVSQPALPVVRMKVDPRLAIDTFFTDQMPSPLPMVKRPTPKRVYQPKVNPRVKSPPKPRVKPKPPVQKSQYSVGELDAKPRLLRNPPVRFPSSIRNATSGRVVVKISISPSGKSKFISVVSSTHPALIPAAKRIASGSRFSSPTRQGRAVKAVMTWPIIIKK